MTRSLLVASWRAVARPPLLIPVGAALLVSLASLPWLGEGSATTVRTSVATLLACGLAASADDPAGEVAAASPYSRPLRCAARLLVGLALALPVAALSLALVEQQVSSTRSLEVSLQMLSLLMIGPAVGFALWAWGDLTQAPYAAAVGVLCVAFAWWAVPGQWGVVMAQPWGPPWEAILIRWSALVLLGLAIVAGAWGEPAARRRRRGEPGPGSGRGRAVHGDHAGTTQTEVVGQR